MAGRCLRTARPRRRYTRWVLPKSSPPLSGRLRNRKLASYTRDDFRRHDVRVVVLLDVRDREAHGPAIHSPLQIGRPHRRYEVEVKPLDVECAVALVEQHPLTLAHDHRLDRRQIRRTDIRIE